MKNRQIKFRAWDKKTNTMREVMEIKFDGTHYNARLIFPTLSAPRNWSLRIFEEIELMQFTGLHDANGAEIYEGDILSDRWKVEVYQNDEGTFMVKFGTNPKMNKPISLKQYLLKREKAGTSICEGYRDCIVIGSIYEAKNKPS